MLKTSVILPAKNRPYFLRFALLSLLNQSAKPDELIIADDGSSENLKGAIAEFLPLAPFKIKYVRQPDQGFRLARNRNNGVRCSTGDYLIFLDQDLILTKNLILTFVENYHPQRFNVCYPLRLTEQQTKRINENVVSQFAFDSIVAAEQLQKIQRQYRKDKLYYFLKLLNLRKHGAKFRGGAVAINKKDFIKINGYDENYIGWGHEDDDVGNRLNKIGIVGKNISRDEFPIHLYHPPHHKNGERVNKDYHYKNLKEIARGRYRAPAGLENPRQAEEISNEQLSCCCLSK